MYHNLPQLWSKSALSLPDWSANLFFYVGVKTVILYKAHRVLQIPLAWNPYQLLHSCHFLQSCHFKPTQYLDLQNCQYFRPCVYSLETHIAALACDFSSQIEAVLGLIAGKCYPDISFAKNYCDKSQRPKSINSHVADWPMWWSPVSSLSQSVRL